MLTFLSRYWWLLVVRGAAAVLFGIVAFTLPVATLAALILVFGAYAFVDGVVAVTTAIGGRTITPHWWVLLLQGLFGIGVGVVTLFNPVLTAIALLVYIAAWAILVGGLQIFAGIKLRDELTGEWWLVLGGALGVAFGILMVWHPAAGAVALLWLIASYAVIWGLTLIACGFGVHRAVRQPMAG